MPPPSLSVIIPVYNEQREIATIVPAVRDAVIARGGDWEILVVDNASTDGTVAAFEALGDDPRIRMLCNDANRGKGYSVRRGMLEARGELRLLCDADCTPSLVSLAHLESLTAQADVVAGSRTAAGAAVGRQQPLRRRAASLAFILLCRLVMAEPLRDVFCGFKLYTGPAAEDIFSRARIDGWAFDAEALALGRALGYTVGEGAIAWVNRPGSRLQMHRVAIPVLRDLISARTHVRRQRRDAAGATAEPRPAESSAPADLPG
jgi:glycosyltransferase involved in cell wall biosynthesis